MFFCPLTLLACFYYDFSFFWGQAVKVKNPLVDLIVSSRDLGYQSLTFLTTTVEIILPFVLLGEREAYLLLSQFSCEFSKCHLVKRL